MLQGEKLEYRPDTRYWNKTKRFNRFHNYTIYPMITLLQLLWFYRTKYMCTKPHGDSKELCKGEDMLFVLVKADLVVWIRLSINISHIKSFLIDL